jgi:hypothetical protein
MRLPILAAVLLTSACSDQVRIEMSAEESRLLAYLARDPYVVIDSTERDGDGYLLVVTAQGNAHVRYLIAPDDPARPQLRLRRMEDACTLETAPNPHPGGALEERGAR